MALRLPPLGDSEFEESIRFALKKFFDIRIQLIKTFGLCRDLPNSQRLSRLDPTRLGTVIGYVWAPYLQKWSASAALFPDEVTVGQALLNGQIDGYINGEGVIHAAPLKDSTNVVAHRLHPGDFGMPESALSNLAYNIVNCDNRGVAVALDQELSKLHATGEWQKTLTANGLGPDADAPLKSPVQHCGGG